ncbi:CARDB domain-containing protein, partial [Cribrihabitans sp. XS_ASV171]
MIISNLDTNQVLHDVTVGADGLRLDPGESDTRTLSFDLPHGTAGVGSLRVTVIADRDDANRSVLNEARAGLTIPQAENNNDMQISVTSISRPYADLVATITGVPDSPRGGETGTVSWSVINRGAVTTGASEWVDQVFISQDAVLDEDDVLIGTVAHSGALGVEESYTVSTDVTLPLGIEGDVQILVVTDADAEVLEPDTRGNNTDNRQVSLSSPYADLGVQALVAPTGSYLANEEVEVAWRVANFGPNPVTDANERWVD